VTIRDTKWFGTEGPTCESANELEQEEPWHLPPSHTSPGRILLVERKPRVNAMIPCSVALPNGYHGVLVVVIVVSLMTDDYHMVVVTAVAAVMPIWLRKSAGRKEHKQDKY
jgi:hypothetical protein